MLTVEKLRAFGANVEEGLGRCINNEQFYLRLAEKAIADPGFEKLMEAAEKGDLDNTSEYFPAVSQTTGWLPSMPAKRQPRSIWFLSTLRSSSWTVPK